MKEIGSSSHYAVTTSAQPVVGARAVEGDGVVILTIDCDSSRSHGITLSGPPDALVAALTAAINAVNDAAAAAEGAA